MNFELIFIFIPLILIFKLRIEFLYTVKRVSFANAFGHTNPSIILYS
jgi:hypothetical protein